MSRANRKRRLLGGLLISLVVGLSSLTVYAHAKMTRSQPANNARLVEAPRLVELWFNEELEPGFTTVEVTDAQGKRVDRGEVTLAEENKKAQVALGELATGTYSVVWKALSKDQHTIRGKFTFTVTATATKSPSVASPSPGSVMNMPARQSSNTMPMDEAQAGESSITWGDNFVRWLSYLAMMTLFGGFAFRVLVLVPALRRANAGDNLAVESALEVSRRRSLLLFWMSVILLIATSVVALIFQAAAVFDKPLSASVSPALWRDVLMRTGYGPSWLLQISATFILLLIVIVLSRRVKQHLSESKALWWAGLAAGALLLVAPSWTGHAAAATKDYRLAIPADWLHLVAGGFWVGGLFHFAVSGLPALQRIERQRRAHALSHLISLFTRIAMPAVALAVLAGLYNTWIHVGSWAAFWETPYGRTLLLKLALVLVMLLLGALNNFHFGKKTKRNSGALQALNDAERASLERGFTSSLKFEAALGVVVLLVTAVLVFITPARKHPVATPSQSSMSIAK